MNGCSYKARLKAVNLTSTRTDGDFGRSGSRSCSLTRAFDVDFCGIHAWDGHGEGD